MAQLAPAQPVLPWKAALFVENALHRAITAYWQGVAIENRGTVGGTPERSTAGSGGETINALGAQKCSKYCPEHPRRNGPSIATNNASSIADVTAWSAWVAPRCHLQKLH